MKIRPSIALALAAAGLAAGCASDPKSAAAPAPGATDGAALYLRVCSVCHGENGDARSRAAPALAKPPRDFTRPEAARDLSREYMIAIVRDGRPHSPMVARESRLTQAQVEAVVDYIRATFMKVPPQPAAR